MSSPWRARIPNTSAWLRGPPALCQSGGFGEPDAGDSKDVEERMKDVAPEESGDALEEPESPAERELESEPESNDEKIHVLDRLRFSL